MTKRAIILGGGGARGPYQVGVWKALREMDIPYSIVTGSSVGALNGALMVQNDYETARRMWERLTVDEVIAEAPDVTEGRLPLLRKVVEQGGLDVSPLERNVRLAVDERRIRESPIEFGLVTTRYPSFRPVQLLKSEIPEGELTDYLLASSAWFPFFRRRTIGDADYIDGAYADNLPAQLAVRCGATEIIAVDLLGTGIVHSYKQDIPIRHIRCHWSLGDMLLFEPSLARKNIAVGYLDGLRAYRKVEGSAYAFHLGSSRDNALRLHRALESIRRRTGMDLLKLRDRIPVIHESMRFHAADQRFLPRVAASPSLGMALTTAAEIAGELLQVPPDTCYHLHDFNQLLLERRSLLFPDHTGQKEQADGGGEPAPQVSRSSRIALRQLLRHLREGFLDGKLPDSFWRMAAISPPELIGAFYLLALELHYLRD